MMEQRMDNKKIDVSIIVPVYDAPEEYLRKCLDSLKNQTLSSYEVIVIDDGSPNIKLKSVVDEYSSIFSVIHTENRGVSSARNTGLSRARGDWVTFVDADDWADQNMYEKLLAKANSSSPDTDIVICDCIVEFDGQKIENHFLPEEFIRWNSESKLKTLCEIIGINKFYNPPEVSIAVPWGKLYRRASLLDGDIQFQGNLPRAQDLVFNLAAFDAARNVVYLPDCIYHYRKYAGSKTNRCSSKIIDEFERVLAAIKKFVDAHPNELLLQGYYSRVVQCLHSDVRLYIFNVDNKMRYSEKRRLLNDLVKRDPYRTALRSIKRQYISKKILIFASIIKMHFYIALYFALNLKRIFSNNLFK